MNALSITQPAPQAASAVRSIRAEAALVGLPARAGTAAAERSSQTSSNGASGAAGGTARKPDDPAKIRDAAQQFEALLLGQILRSIRESGKGWLGAGDDTSGDCATGFAEEQFAIAMAKQGGLGLADLIAAGLKREG
jgi:Rod binding domain-containing protein